MKSKKTLNFLTVTLFCGVLLTFMLFVGIDTVWGFGKEDDEKGFNERFRTNEMISEFVRYFDYKVFGHIDGGDYIIGEDDWLFEAVDSQNGYERLLDYIGGDPLTDEELEQFSNIVTKRALLYEKEGKNYMMVVIPDAMNVCDDKVPAYLGEYSSNSRLSQITRFFESSGFDGFINPSDAMKNSKEDIALCNNTENSINAYGAYLIYDTVMDRLSSDDDIEFNRIERKQLDFYTRLTDGKSTAKKARIEAIVKNRTVSLSNNAPENYRILDPLKNIAVTQRTDVDVHDTLVVIECTNDWDRIQLMPYFSNTFDRVVYRDHLLSDPYAMSDSDVSLVIQIIRESELANILN